MAKKEQSKELVITVAGEIIESNLDAWREHAMAEIAKADMTLTTDEDFETAESVVKNLITAHKQLGVAKDEVLKQMEDVYTAIQTLEEVDEATMRTKRSLEKQIKDRKDERKAELVGDAAQEIAKFRADLVDATPQLEDLVMTATTTKDLDEAVHRKRSLDSMKEALDAVVHKAKLEMTAFATQVNKNLGRIKQIPAGHMPMFQNLRELLLMSTEMLEATIKERIASHNQIIADEKAREDREAREKLERDQAAQRAAAERKAAEPVEDVHDDGLEPAGTPQNRTQEQETPPTPVQGSDDADKTQPAAFEEPSEDAETSEYVIYMPMLTDLATAKKAAGYLRDKFESRSWVKEVRLTTPPNLKKRLANE